MTERCLQRTNSTVVDRPKTEPRRFPLIRQNTASCCDFQRNKNRKKDSDDGNKLREEDSKCNTATNGGILESMKGTGDKTSKKASLTVKLPDIMSKFKTQLGLKTFIAKSQQAVERRKRTERPWVKGNEISPFFHVWQTSEDHVADQRFRPRVVRRVRSMPRNYNKFLKIENDKALEFNGPETKMGFGIIRDCCSHPRIRIKTFPGS